MITEQPQAAHATCDFIEVRDHMEWDRLTADAAFFNAVRDGNFEDLFPIDDTAPTEREWIEYLDIIAPLAV